MIRSIKQQIIIINGKSQTNRDLFIYSDLLFLQQYNEY